ncbi:aminotransferase class I/II-fold pyridoxal phosphate-dependent enzyme [Spirillospora sp. CA-294931]|uniref:aminotransferase class I/II-fold pyridoxal phosphate-dependent enzyme n=1 Tax=Spirillospora sp. CA-294931 TaxID=3240042 RepID=UPI003D920523
MEWTLSDLERLAGARTDTAAPAPGEDAATAPGDGRPDTATKILGRVWSVPVGLAPPPGLPFGHESGELGIVRGAAAAGVPAVVGAASGRSVEELAAGGEAGLWLRIDDPGDLDLDLDLDLVRRAEEAGVEALVLDAPRFERLRLLTTLPIVVSGLTTAARARRAADAGADALVLSRDLDPEVMAAVAGRLPVLLGGGVRHGRDVLAALALGADAVLVGRPVLHGLTVGGGAGVEQVAAILRDELAEAMAAAGIGAVTDIATRPTAGLRRTDLHASVADPMMDTMNFLNEVTLRYPEAVSFAPGRPYDGFFDTEQIFTHVRRYLDHLAAQGRSPAQVREALFQYGPSAGLIRDLIADSLRADEGIDVAPESIVVTVGCQEAMFLALRALISGPRDVVMVSSPCYVGIVGAARLLDAEVAVVEEGPDGLSCADLEAAILAERARGRRPRAVYVVPDHSNPSGVTLPAPARHELLDLAERLDVLILEDSPYRLVSPGPQAPTLKSLDRHHRVVHLGSYAKTLFPGARVGYAVADQPVLRDDGTSGLLADELAKIKSMVTVNTSALSQAAVAGALLESGGRVSELAADTAAHYGDTMRYILDGLEREFPPELGVSWNSPTGGFFLTLQVPFAADNAALIRSAQDFGVIWTPMSYFHPHGGGDRTIRLSTSYVTRAQVDEGLARLAAFVRAESQPTDR